MRFKRFYEEESYHEIWDFLSDPTMMAALGTAGTAAGLIGNNIYRRMARGKRELHLMQDAWNTMDAYIKKYGADSPEVDKYVQSTGQTYPAMKSLMQNYVNDLRRQ